MSSRIALAALAILAVLGVQASLAGNALLAQPLVASCPFYGYGYAGLGHGFYVTDYPSTNLAQVTLGYSTTVPGQFSISLTAHRNTYDGPMIGVTQTATVQVPAPPAETLVTFDFGGAPVTPGDTVAFIQRDYSPFGTTVLFDAGQGSCNSSIFETNGTDPPLDRVVGAGVGVAIYTRNPSSGPTACIASDTVLCVDDYPGDGRFKVSASFHTAQGGGRFGKAQAIPLAQLGIVHGGLFWFFGADNPEMLLKIVNGCAVNDHGFRRAPTADFGCLAQREARGRPPRHQQARGALGNPGAVEALAATRRRRAPVLQGGADPAGRGGHASQGQRYARAWMR